MPVAVIANVIAKVAFAAGVKLTAGTIVLAAKIVQFIAVTAASMGASKLLQKKPPGFGDASLADRTQMVRSPVCEYVRERVDGDGDAMVATCEAKRRGYPDANATKFSVADAKKAGLWGKSGPWTQYPKRMLQLRARGFALRDAFPDVLKGLVTAEEAQDYPTQPEPVVVRPKFDEPTVVKLKPEPAKPADDPVGKARLAVSKADTIDALDTLRRLVDKRLGEGVFNAQQHDELVKLMHHRAEMLIEASDTGTEFEHEAASTEAVS